MRPVEKIIYSVGILAFAAIIVFGTAYAFIFANLAGVEVADTILISSAGAECAVTPGPAFNSSNEILPGWSESYTFSVTNNTNEPIIYNILFSDVVNTFVNKEELVFTLSSTNAGGTLTQTELPSSNGTVLSNITIPARTTQEYTLTVSYLSAGYNQIDDLGKNFSFRILIDNCGEEIEPLYTIRITPDIRGGTPNPLHIYVISVTSVDTGEETMVNITSVAPGIINNLPAGEYVISVVDSGGHNFFPRGDIDVLLNENTVDQNGYQEVIISFVIPSTEPGIPVSPEDPEEEIIIRP